MLPFQKMVDLSVPIEPSPSERVGVSIRYVDHEEGAAEMCRIFGASRHDLPSTGGWAGEEVRLITHSGTHVDAPWHYGPTSEGSPAQKIDDLPLAWFFGPGVVLDMSGRSREEDITAEDLERAFKRIGVSPHAGLIVLIRTGAGESWGSEEYPALGAGLTQTAVLWLTDRGVRVVGTDAFSLDAPFEVMRRRFLETGDRGALWPAHFAGHSAAYCQIEKLANLGELPDSGFWVACFPVKIARASAGWTRAVGLVP